MEIQRYNYDSKTYNLSDSYVRKCCYTLVTTLYFTLMEAGAAKPEQITEPQFTAKQICMFQVNRAGRVRYSLTYSPRTDRQSFLYWDMTVPYKTIAIVDTEKMYQLYQTLSSLNLEKLNFVKQGSVENLVETVKKQD